MQLRVGAGVRLPAGVLRVGWGLRLRRRVGARVRLQVGAGVGAGVRLPAGVLRVLAGVGAGVEGGGTGIHPVWSAFTLLPGRHFRQMVSARPEYSPAGHFLHGVSGRGE